MQSLRKSWLILHILSPKGGDGLKITFHGAAKTVTGSCFQLEVEGTQVLVDCGLFQGGSDADEQNSADFAFNPRLIDYVLLTHAHIDHSGLIPRLVKLGFQGKILATKATTDLCRIMLLDSAHIQEMEAEWLSRKSMRAGGPAVEPIYSVADAEKSLTYFESVAYDQDIELGPHMSVHFRNAGHILGSAILEVYFNGDQKEGKIVFSGDLGREDQSIICDPHIVEGADFLVLESTYGNRYHDSSPEEKRNLLHKTIKEAIERKGKIIIPAFAVARTQDLLYELNHLVEQNMIPRIPVYIDSPLAISATEIFSNNPEYFDEETQAMLKAGDNPFEFPGLRFARTVEESKALNTSDEQAIIISASGMCEAGRIKHHLKHNLWRSDATILFIGFQAKGTLGRKILDGEKNVKIFGEPITVNAHIKSIEGFSSHADKNDLINWVESFRQNLKKIFCVHGEQEAAEELAQALRDKFSIDTVVPEQGQSFILTAEQVIEAEMPIQAGVPAEHAEEPSLDEDLNTFMALVKEFEETVIRDKAIDKKQLVSMQTKIVKKMMDIISQELTD